MATITAWVTCSGTRFLVKLVVCNIDSLLMQGSVWCLRGGPEAVGVCEPFICYHCSFGGVCVCRIPSLHYLQQLCTYFSPQQGLTLCLAPSGKNFLFSGGTKEPVPSWMSLLDETGTFQGANPVNGVVEQGLTCRQWKGPSFSYRVSSVSECPSLNQAGVSVVCLIFFPIWAK